jgi:hypothetical protein
MTEVGGCVGVWVEETTEPVNRRKGRAMSEESNTVVKPGYKTSEFWLTLGATVVGFLIASGVIPETGVWPKVVALVTAAFTAMGYTISRGLAKKG